MSRSAELPINASLLIWARETAGYSLEGAARKLGIAEAKLREAEAGNVLLTFAQLRKAADIYKRPLAAFFAPQPPPPVHEVHDFRLHPDADAKEISPRLKIAVRIAEEHRRDALELANALGTNLPRLTEQATLRDQPEGVAGRLRAALGEQNVQADGAADISLALKTRKRAVEALGVLVFEISRIDVGEMRGFSLALDPFPVVVLNGADSPAGRSFTLLHEMAHVLLRQDGICDLETSQQDPRDARVEVFCNAVAAATLVPAEALSNVVEGRRARWDAATLGEIASRFKVSREVILRRLLTLGLATENQYRAMRHTFEAEYAEIRARAPRARGGPGPAVMAVRNLGRPLVGLILDAYDDERIPLSTVSDYLGVKIKHVPRIRELLRRGESVE